MHVLIAPDRFSGPLNAVQAARALASGWAETVPTDRLSLLPMSDGAAGLLDVVMAARGGSLVPVSADGPLGAPTVAAVLHVPGDGGGTAYVEADQVLGTHLVPRERAHAAKDGSSAGLAALLEAAVATNAGRIVVGLPTVAATHDGGRGLLGALGGATAAREVLARRDLVLAVADDLPLLGLHGAGALLGEDPDVGPALAQELERDLGAMTADLERQAGPPPNPVLLSAGTEERHGRLASSPGSGAGGGVAFALRLLGARPMPGADVVAGAVGLAGAVARADLVLTGSAVFDAPALTQSVVATVARTALDRALPVVVVAEEIRTSRREVAPLGISGTYEVQDTSRLRPRLAAPPAADLETAVRARARRLARTWSTS
ncbi:glycerate kinase [Georgenia alba]|uniref:Glycerate kinase n=1 Tax=Georgenia alba TaxID=2233858 RepID=A0ABW2Q9B0_9MICO